MFKKIYIYCIYIQIPQLHLQNQKTTIKYENMKNFNYKVHSFHLYEILLHGFWHKFSTLKFSSMCPVIDLSKQKVVLSSLFKLCE